MCIFVSLKQEGNVRFDGEVVVGSPPLWCAAAAGHLDIVRTLINKHNAYVNSTTRTKSTPLRAACYDGHLDIVKFLIENGADIEIANRHGHTCLMIACYKGHFETAQYLIECGADVNRKSVKGNTALHDCADSGSLEIMQLLLKHKAKIEGDAHGITPIIAAALAGHPLIVELLVKETNCDVKEIIDAYDMLGATYVDKKRDMMGALQFWRQSLEIKMTLPSQQMKLLSSASHSRWQKLQDIRDANASSTGVTLEKSPCTPCPYPRREITSVAQLEDTFADPDEMRMQSLYIRERVIGPAHPDTTYYIRYRGAIYADTGNFEMCMKLWMYALDMQLCVLDALNPMIQSSLYSFSELFSFIVSKSAEKVKFDDLFAVLERAQRQWNYAHIAYKYTKSMTSETERNLESNLNDTLVIVLHFIALVCRIQGNLTKKDNFILRKCLYDWIKLNPRGRRGSSMLHLACMNNLSCPTTRPPSDLSTFPIPEMIKLLLEVGASPNQLDDNGNSPLHLVARFSTQSSAVVNLLLEYGAHLDASNKDGLTPLSIMRAEAMRKAPFKKIQIFPLKHMNLQCLSARVLQRYNVPVENYLPGKLAHFVRMH